MDHNILQKRYGNFVFKEMIFFLCIETAYSYELLMNVSGTWNSADKYSVVAYSTKIQAVDIHYTITYSKDYLDRCASNETDCFPRIMTHINFFEPEIVSCSIIAESYYMTTSDINYWNIPLSLEDSRSNCSLHQRDVVCKKTLSFGQGMPVFYSVALQSCSMNEVPLLKYSVVINGRDSSACVNKIDLISIEHCNFNYTPSLHGPFGMSSVKEYENLVKPPLFNVAWVGMSGCHPFAKEFICRNIFPECTDNGLIFPCKKMCKQFTASCKTILSIIDLHFECSFYAESSDKNVCFYKSLPCNNDFSALQNGNITYISQGKLYYNCNFGYELEGNNTRTCVDGKWKPSAPLCVFKHITTPALPCNNETSDLQNGNITKDVSQDILYYNCNFGYELQGPELQTCVDGDWTPPGEPVCVLKQMTVTALDKHITRLPLPCTDEASYLQNGKITKHESEDILYYYCNLGYERQGPKLQTCVDGNWIPPNATVCVSKLKTTAALPCINDVGYLQNGKITKDASEDILFYHCNFGYELQGPKTRTCVDGNWKPMASEHVCVPKHIITIPLLLGFAVLFSCIIIGIILFRYKRKKRLIKEAETEMRLRNIVYEFDAFVSYSSKDRDFVEDAFLSKLEPSYKLCIHGRDFVPGTAIVRNIMESLQKSAMCFIMLSRSYVESPWCTHEFTVAYSRLTSDNLPKNRLVVITLEEIQSLRDHVPSDIQSYLYTSTYIERKNEHFWTQVLKAMEKALKKEFIARNI